MATIEKRGEGRSATSRVKIRRKGLDVETKTFDTRKSDLRHEGTSRLFELDFDMAVVQRITGHKILQMLLHYTHRRPTDIGEKLQKRRVSAPVAVA